MYNVAVQQQKHHVLLYFEATGKVLDGTSQARRMLILAVFTLSSSGNPQEMMKFEYPFDTSFCFFFLGGGRFYGKHEERPNLPYSPCRKRGGGKRG